MKIINVPVSFQGHESTITIPRASAIELRFANTNPGQLHSSAVRFTVAAAPNSPRKIISTRSCSVPDAEGRYSLVLSAQDTDVEPGKYFWDTRAVDVGFEALLGIGVFIVSPIAEEP